MTGAVYETTSKVEEDVLCESCLADKYDADMRNYRSFVTKISDKPCDICGYPEKKETDEG